MSNVAIRVQTHGPTRGECNICGVVGRLTEDHVPPKGVIQLGAVETRHLVDRLSGSASNALRPVISQNGLKYRTICARCNNALLGARYDPALKYMLDQVSDILRQPNGPPLQFSVRGDIPRITRAVLGHVAAQGVGRYDKGPITEPLRDFLQDETIPALPTMRLYYAVYPYRSRIVIRDAAYSTMQDEGATGIWLLKTFPVAFMATWDQPATMKIPMLELTALPQAVKGELSEIPMLPYQAPDEFWPEVSRDGLTIVGESAVASYLRKAGE